MFSKLALFTVAIMTTFVAASVDKEIEYSCNTGALQCCKNVKDTSEYSVREAIALVGIAVDGITGQAGFNCSPITVVGAGSGSHCTEQPVCCTGNNFNGVVALGCSAANVSL